MSIGPPIRKTIGLVHLWIGLSLGLYFAMLGVTGSFLVFRSNMEEAITPELVRAPSEGSARQLPISAVMAEVRRSFPHADEATLKSFTAPRYAGGAYTLSVEGKSVLVSPYTGEVLREIENARNPIEIIGNLHMSLLWVARGMLVNTYGGLLTALLVASGLWLWWPKTIGQFRTRLKVKRKSSLKRTMNDLHNLFGIAGLVFLLMACLTGSVFGIWDTVHNTLYAVLRQTKPADVPQSVVVPPKTRRLPLKTLVADVEREMSGAQLRSFTYPAKIDAPVTAYGAIDEGLSSYVSLAIDPYTGKLLQKEDARKISSAGIAMRWVHFLHLGQWGGWTVKIVYAVFGLLPLGLYITGVGRWFLRRKATTASARAQSTRN